MAREHARVKLSIWEDDDFRALSGDAQRLYFVLMTSLKLDYCGVTDWRPMRIAALCADWTVETVERAAEELSRDVYIVIDVETEEVLLRSFIRNDELLESPNMAVAMRKAHGSVASTALRQIVIHELIRLRADKPSLKGWDKVSEMLHRASMNPSDYPSFRASVNPSPNPSGGARAKGSDNPSASTSPTTAPAPAPTPDPPTGPALKRGERLPEEWTPTPGDVAWQREQGISDLDARRWLEKFRNYWHAKPGKDAVKLDWSKTWRNWLITEQERSPRVVGAPKRSASWQFGQ